MAVTHFPMLAALVLTSFAAAARPPANVTPDPELKRWFESLKQPHTGEICCSISDCRFVSFTIENGDYEVTIDDFVYVVPKPAVIPSVPNPTGKAVACYTIAAFNPPPPKGVVATEPQDVIEILCFIPPRPPS